MTPQRRGAALGALALWLAVTARDVGAAPSEPRPAASAPRPTGHAERVDHRDLAQPPTRGPSAAPVTIEVYFVPGPGMPSAARLHERQVSGPSGLGVR